MNANNTCGNCGNLLRANDPGGICPSCLLGHAIYDKGNNPTLDASGNAYPHVEELVGRFPNLEIVHLIGQGGMGAVYRARQTKLDRVVALKVLSPRLGNDPSFAERFTREARTLAKMSHPNIVTVFDYGKIDDLNYLVMEFIDGVNLRDAIQAGKLTPTEALAIVPQICDALQYAHNQGVIHRDIKPENILLDSQGRVKIADFGLAKLLEPAQTDFTLTGTHQVLGTRNYMAPEQIEKPEVVDHRADIYSLGVVFYELLTGELPIGRFSVPSESAHIDGRLDDIVLRTLEKDPNRRFQQASDIRSAVDSLSGQPERPVDHFAQDSRQNPKQDRPHDTLATLPFTINQIYDGLAEAHGIAHLFSDRLELEFEIVDSVLGAIKSSAKKVTIPIQNLINVSLVQGVFADRIECQTSRLEHGKDVPNSKQGRFSLRTKRADLELAKQFVGQADRFRRETAPSESPANSFQPAAPAPQAFRQPIPPKKSPEFEGNDQPTLWRQEVIESLKVPRIGLFIIGLLHLLTGLKGLVNFKNWTELKPLNFQQFKNVEVSVFLPKIEVGDFQTFASLIVAIVLISISSRLRQPRDYKFVMGALIAVMLVPIHSAYIFTFFLSIWALVVMNDDKTKSVFEFADRHKFPGRRSRSSFAVAMTLIMLVIVGTIVVPLATSLLTLTPARIERNKIQTENRSGITEKEPAKSMSIQSTEDRGESEQQSDAGSSSDSDDQSQSESNG